MSDVTYLLRAIDAGDPKAAEELLPLVYEELRRSISPHNPPLAAGLLRRYHAGRSCCSRIFRRASRRSAKRWRCLEAMNLVMPLRAGVEELEEVPAGVVVFA